MYKTLAWLGVLAVLVAAPLAAQTPEGTVITNTVTASYTDANGGTYTPATASVSVTVAFKGGIDVTGVATVTPTSPSTGNHIDFTVNNIGNGPDTVQVNVTAAAGVSNLTYNIGATPYATLAALNTALLAIQVAGISGNVVVRVNYDVASGQGGQTIPIALTATSRRDNSKTDTQTTNVVPPVSGSVTVTALTPAINRVPGLGVYSTTFQVSNTTSSPLTFTLGLVVGGSLNNATLPGGASVLIAAGTQATVTVNYDVPLASAAGSTGTVNLTATSGTFTSNDTHTITVIKPALTLTKTAYRSDQTTVIAAGGSVVPGETIWYKLVVTNNGTATANTVNVSDVLPTQVTYVSHTTPTGWSVSEAAGTVTGSVASLATGAGNAVTIWVQVTVK